ncbi:MAG: NADH-quinone oxidoreductase subunit NuoH [Candidatus Kapabacteria bacterium]|nr:NADH-quinone oxidoreductase subunit NuoH [Candidatus Kapabacteria bacterium]
MTDILQFIFTNPFTSAVAKGGLVLNVILIVAAFLVYAERKVSAWMQFRVGPNRVGPLGLLQSFADVLKLYTKEDIVPDNADRFFHRLAPLIAIAIALAILCVLTPASYITIGDVKYYISIAPNVNVGVLIILALTSVAVYGITLAGWSSNNKYSLMGGLRSSAQMISYELSMGLSLVGVLMLAGSLDMNKIVASQANGVWNIVTQPLGFIIFLVSSFAETNRAPFDLPEAEPELVGGYHTEYSGMKFGLFYLAEYANMFTASAVITTLFLGGYHAPGLSTVFSLLGLNVVEGDLLMVLIQVGTFAAKVGFMLFFFIWVRWTLPRFRYDQLMNLGWKVLLPLSLVNIILTGGVMLALQQLSIL